MSSQRKPAHAFSMEDDIAILEEVIVEQPFGKRTCDQWKQIHETVQIPVKDGAVLKRRFNLLLEHYQKRTMKNLRASGVEEEFNKMVKLLQEIEELRNMRLQESENGNASEQNECVAPEEYRDSTCSTFKRVGQSTGSESIGSSKRLKEDDMTNFLLLSDDQDHDLKKDSLDLKNKIVTMKEQELYHQKEQLALQKDMLAFQKDMLTFQKDQLALQKVNDEHKREIEVERLEMDKRKAELEVQERRMMFEFMLKTFNSKQ